MKTKILLRIIVLFLLTGIMQKLIAGNNPSKICFNKYTVSYRDTTPPFLYSASVIINPKNNKDTAKCDSCIIVGMPIAIKPPKITIHIGNLITIIQSRDSITIVDNTTQYRNKFAIPNAKLITTFEVDAGLAHNLAQNSQIVNQQTQKIANTSTEIKKTDQKK